MRAIATLVSSLTAVLFTISALAAAPRTATSAGDLDGIELTQTYAYLGFPYAAPPVGANRFAPPQAPQKWSGVFQAKDFGPKCLQRDLGSKRTVGQEDCLTMNVWRPKVVNRALPVLFFIHGGGNTIGSSSDSLYGTQVYDGARLAEEGNVVVTINYRLGALGFLAHPSLRDASGLQGNYAILDQIAALRFVKNSIANFGGDPNNITVFGESAGAINTLVLLASPLASGLFHHAIIESGFVSEQPLATAEAEAQKFAAAAGCTDGATLKACLMALSADQILEASSKISASPLGVGSATIDGYVLKTGIIESFRSGTFNKVPVIIGTNRDEFRTLLPALVPTGPIFTENDYEKVLVLQFGRQKADSILKEYPASDYFTPKLALEEVLNDSQSHCPARTIARALVGSGVKTYRYVFTHTGDHPIYAAYGAGHALELPFVFGNLGLSRSFREFVFSQDVRDFWSSFASEGTPTAAKQPPWPTAEADVYLDLAPSSEAKAGFHTLKCNFWDAL